MGQAERTKGATWAQAVMVGSDLAAIAAGSVLGYYVRFYSPLTGLLPPDKGIPPPSLYLLGALVSVVVFVPLMHGAGLYRITRGRAGARAGEILRVQALGMLIVAALSFFYRSGSFSRVAVPLIWGFTFLLTCAGRALVRRWLRSWTRLRPIRFAIVGVGDAAERLKESLLRSSYPHRFMGVFVPALGGAAAGSPGRTAGPASFPGASRGNTALDPLGDAVLGDAAAIRAAAEAVGLDLIVLAAPDSSHELLVAVHAQCQEADLDFLFVPDLFSVWGHPLRIEEVEGLPVIRLRDLPLAGWNGVWKRTFDLVLSLVLLLLLSPALLLLALAVRLDSPGPVFHSQERVGRDRRSFRMVKFRSMRTDAESASGPVWASTDDPRRTRIGRFLRKWSLDELPQLWNVLKGEMSLIGPRPERPFFVHRFESQVADYYDRHRVKSGMTGWAQVHGLRGDTPIEERTRYDLYYVENWSLWLDLRILWMTAWAVVRHKGS